MIDQDYSSDQLNSVAQTCRYMKPSSRGRSTNEGISCSMCGSWNGSECTRKAFESIMSELQLD